MPANLTPQYRQAEERYRQAATHEQRLEALREMMALLPKHKGTEKLKADLRQRIASLERESSQPRRGGAHHGDPGHVPREGAGQWALIGPPNAGKSALLRALTHAHPVVAAYPFTTHVPQPGMMRFEDVQIQLVDTPAVSPQHTEPWLVNLVHNADGTVLVLDPTAEDPAGDLAALEALLERARVWPAGRARPADAPPFVVERPVLVVLNKCDLDPDRALTTRARDALPRDLPALPLSAGSGEGLDALRRTLFERLGRIRIYAREPGHKPDLERPFVLPGGATVADLARAVHKDVAQRLRFARIWGHARFEGQQVDRDHVLADRDIVELHA
jgi:hypothetical protein